MYAVGRALCCDGRCRKLSYATVAYWSSDPPLAGPFSMQAGDHVLQPGAVLPIHLQSLKRVNFIELPQQLALDLIGDNAFDKGDEHQTLAGRDRNYFVQGGRWINHHRARFA